MKNTMIKLYSTVVLLFIIALTLGTSTFAWFTNNNTVYTNKITGKTSESDIHLYLKGSSFGSSWTEELGLSMTEMVLWPVSTEDMKSYIAAKNQVGTDNGVMINNFTELTPDQYADFFYQETFYVKADAPKGVEGKMDLYLDISENYILEKLSNLYTTCRLGFNIYDDQGTLLKHVIYRFTEAFASTSSTGNTKYEGFTSNTTGGQVMVVDEVNGFKAVDDPSVYITENAIYLDENDVVVEADESLVLMDLNRDYKVEMVFYIEGCDPDCTDAQSLDSFFQLYFTGVLTDE